MILFNTIILLLKILKKFHLDTVNYQLLYDEIFSKLILQINYESFHIQAKNGKNNVNKVKKNINKTDKNISWYFSGASEKLGSLNIVNFFAHV